MSQMGGGASSPEFDKLIDLAKFVQGPGYVERVQELQALEASSKDALEKANAAEAAAIAAHGSLDKREAAIKEREATLVKDQLDHNRRVAGLDKALSNFR